MQHTIFCALFVVQYKLHRHARIAWPLGLGRLGPVPDQVAGIGLVAVVVVHRLMMVVCCASLPAWGWSCWGGAFPLRHDSAKPQKVYTL